MSNQYYNFLNKELLKYFENSYVRPGDRYFLILNNDNEIKNLKYSIEHSKDKSIQKFEDKVRIIV